MNYNRSESLNRYFKSIKNLNPLTKEEESELAVEIQKGNRAALNKLIEHNLKIVVTIANKNVVRDHNIPVDDLIQQGNLGLYEAALRFKPDSNVRFASFAGLRILKMMNSLIDQCGRVVRIPVNQEYERYLKIKNGEDVDNIGSIKLDDLTMSDSNKTKADTGILAINPEIEREFELEHFDVTVSSMLKTLSERDQQIIKLRYGIGTDSGEEMSTSEIAEEIGISQVRVCQLLKDIKDKLASSI